MENTTMPKPLICKLLLKTIFTAVITILLLSLGLVLLPARSVHAQGPVINLGDLPPGKVVTITFRAAITTSLSAGATQVCNQGTISGTNFTTIVTDDPTTGAANDPTCTPLDLPAVSIAAGAAPSESGPTNGSFIISLDDPAPGGGLTIAYNLTGSTAGNPADYSLAAGTNVTGLTAASFTIAAGAISATITIVPVDDPIDDDGETVQLNLSAGSGYQLGAPASASQTITDNDTRGVTLAQSGGSTNLTEGGATDTYTIRLNTIPTATVTISFNTGGQVDPIAGLTFPANATALNPQTVTVTATDDTMVEGNHSQIISHSASGGGYDGVSIPNVTASITDNDIAYTLAANQASVTEGDTGATPISFSITRTGDITRSSSVNVSLGGTATNGVDYNNVVPAGGVINFGASVTQTAITMDVVGDFIVEGNETIIVTLSGATGTGGGGTGTVSGSPASTTILDDDAAGVNVTPTTLTISEPNTTGVFTIALTSQPTATVTIDLSTLSDECTFPASVTLTSATWTGVPVTVTAVDDPVTDGPQSCLIVTAPTGSADPVYNNTFDPANVNVTVNDDDVPGFTITPAGGLTTTEAGGTATFTVRLRTEPAATVTLTLISSFPGEGDVGPSSLTFSTANWNISQTVIITGVNEDIDDGDQPYLIITNAPSSNDPDYNGAGADPVDVNVTNLDDDTAGFVISPISGNTSEAGLTATFTISLTSQPIAAISIAVISTDLTEGTVNPASVNFTPLNWNIPQTVTVSGLDDPNTDGNITYTIQLGPITGGDSLYTSLNPPDVLVVNLDNDATPIFLPMILKGFVSAPDLVVTSLTTSSSSVTVVIRNQGNAPVVDAFWVDVYFNPGVTPSLNKRWQDIASHGQVWGVTGSGLSQLGPGGTLTLTTGDSFYFAQFSSTPPLPAGANVFALADSVDFSTSYGAVQESDEGNNLFGPVVSAATGGSSAAGQTESPSPEGLPPR
jgi:hypothetical protein